MRSPRRDFSVATRRGLSGALIGAALAFTLGGCTDFAGPIPSQEQTTNPNTGNPGTGNPGTGDPGTGNPDMGGSQPPPPEDMGMPAGDDMVSFDDDVHPILVSMCGMCHAEPGGSVPGHAAGDPDVAFDEVQGMSSGAPVYQRILMRAAGEGGFMPPGYVGCEELGTQGCLSQEQYDTIALWVQQGAMNR